jgi:GNAT superfamily N-acetyltransferase
MDPSANVRPGSPNDLTACLDLLQGFYREEEIPTTPEQMTTPLARLLDKDGGTVLVASMEDAIIGICVVATVIGVEQGGRVAELTDLYVLPDWRGCGTASRLLAAAEEWARAEGCTCLQLVVTPGGESRGMTEFYRKRSFRETGRTLLVRPL